MTIDCRDCGTCERCQQTDDYGPAWRNPEFRSPDDAVTSTDSARPATETRRGRVGCPLKPRKSPGMSGFCGTMRRGRKVLVTPPGR